MRILVVSGKDYFSTFDVFNGICEGLVELGHQVISYDIGSLMKYEEISASVLKTSGVWDKVYGDQQYNAKAWANIFAKGIVFDAINEKVDAVLAISGHSLWNQDIIRCLQAQDIPCILWLTEEPYDHSQSLIMGQAYDLVFSNEENSSLGCSEPWKFLPLGCRPNFHKPMPVEKQFDLSFIGHLFDERIKFFEKIYHYLRTKKTYFGCLRLWNAQNSHVLDLVDPKHWPNVPIPQERTVIVYSQSKICLNLHRSDDTDGIMARTPGPRTWEIAACGGFQMVDSKREGLWDVFDRDEIVTFDGPEDLIEKADYYLKHREERETMASKARSRVLENCSYRSRAVSLVTMIENLKNA